jgi:hypothetical protein
MARAVTTMRYLHRVLLCLAAILVVSGCRSATADPPNPAQVKLGEAFTLGLGQDATIAGEPLRVKFDQVLEDSRCPRKVSCVWTGEARLRVLVDAMDGHAPTAVEFNTNPAPGQTRLEAKTGPFTIRLLSLDPYPETPEAIPSSEYRAVLRVVKD